MREKQGHGKSKLNNKGMSLIEVMVAVIILALVTGPLLHSFVTAAKFNVRSKERQRVASAAQSIMEGFKAYNLDQICYQFNNLSTLYVYSDSSVGSVWEKESEHKDEYGNLVTSTSARKEGEKNIFTPPTSNSYTFCMQNIDFEGTFYDAKVTVSPNAGAASTASLAAPTQMNAYLDAVYKQPSYDDSLAYTDILSGVLTELRSRDEYYPDEEYVAADLETDKITVQKITNINITRDPSNADIQFVNIENIYEYKVTDYPYYKADGSLDTFDKNFDPIARSPVLVYDNTSTVGNGAKLENIYVYYYPAYKNSLPGVEIASEKININNGTGVEKKVFLIKQYNESFSSTLNTCENSYTPQINESGDGIKLYHNLYTNLSDPSGTVGTVDMNVVHETSDILPTESKVLVYDVHVSIYKQGEAAAGFTDSPLLTLDGSMNDD